MALQIRRGTNAERLGITLVEGEVVYVTDFELVTIEVTSVNSTTNVLVTTLNHGLSVNDKIKFIGNSSNGLVEGTVYFVKTIPSQTDFTLSTTQGGTTLDITGTATSLQFAVGPTDGLGVPYGYSISPLYVGDGVTAGGNPAGASVLADLYDVSIGVYGNVGQHGIALANNHVLQYNDVTNQWENRRDLILDGENIYINRDGSANNSTLYFKDTSESIRYNNTTGFFEFTGDIAREALFLGSNGTSGTVSTGTGPLNLNTPSGQVVNVQRDLVVGGNLTVNGTTTTVNSTTLTVDDKNIELASTASPSNTTADGGGITLKGNTDKKIFWQNSDSRWYYDNGDGTNNIFVRDLTDLSSVNTGPFSKGDIFHFNGTEWTNSNIVQADTSTQRATFQYNNSDAGVLSSGLFARRNFTSPSAFAAGDGTGIAFQLSNNNGAPTTFAAVSGSYSATNPVVALRTSTDNFANNSISVATFDNDAGRLAGSNLVLNADHVGTAVSNAAIIVERGDSTDASLTWTESTDEWVFTNDVRILGGDLTTTNNTGNLFNNDGVTVVNVGNGATTEVNLGSPAAGRVQIKSPELDLAGGLLTFNANNTGAASNAAILVERGTSGDDSSLTWVEAAQTWIATSGLIGANYIGTNGLDVIINNDNGTLGAGDRARLLVKRGAAQAEVAVRWNENTDRWETTTNGTTYIEIPNQDLDLDSNPSFAGVTAGSIRVGITGDNEIDTSTGNLTIDSAGGTVIIDDDLSVNNNLVVFGTTTLGNGTDDAVNLNSGTVNIGTTLVSTTTIGDAATDTLTVNATSTFNNNLTVGSSATDTLTVNSAANFNHNVTVGSDSLDSLTVNSTSTFNNNLTIGSTAGDLLTVVSQVASNVEFTNNDGGTPRGVSGIVSNNDHWFVGGGSTGFNAGFMVIATGDDGTEPIYARQYNGNPAVGGTIARTLTLLDNSGNTQLPGNLTVGGNGYIYSAGGLAVTLSGSNVTITGDLTVNGTTTTINSTTLDVDDINITVAKGAANAAAANGAGLTVDGANATITYLSGGDSWNLNKKTFVPDLQVDNININSNTISSTDTNGNIVLDTNGTGVVDVVGDFTANTISSNAQFHEDAAGEQIAVTIARTVFALDDTTDPVTLASTNRRAMKVLVAANNNSQTHVIEALVMRDPTSPTGAQVTFYGELRTANLATFTADYDSGSNTIRLRAQASGVAIAPAIYPPWETGVEFKVVRTSLF